VRALLQILQAANALHDSDYTGVVEVPAFVFTSLYVGRIRCIDECGVKIALGCRRWSGDRCGDAMAVDCDICNRQHGLWGLGGGGDGLDRFRGVAAEKLSRSVDDHLGSVDSVRGVEVRVVAVLTIGELMGGEAVVPAAIFPVVHVFTQNDDLYAADGLKLVELAEKSIGGRAA